MTDEAPVVGVVMGSDSDWPTMRVAAEVLAELDVAYEARVVSAHRTPDLLFSYAEAARGRGLRAIIAGAGGAAHLPGMLASKTPVPVLGVPVATFAIGESGAANAALFAVAMLATTDASLAARLDAYRSAQTERVLGVELPDRP